MLGLYSAHLRVEATERLAHNERRRVRLIYIYSVVGRNAGASTRRVGLGLQARAIELLATKHATMFQIADSQTAVKRVGFYMHNVKNRYLLKMMKIEEERKTNIDNS